MRHLRGIALSSCLLAFACGRTTTETSQSEAELNGNVPVWVVSGRLDASEYRMGAVIAVAEDAPEEMADIERDGTFAIQLREGKLYAMHFVREGQRVAGLRYRAHLDGSTSSLFQVPQADGPRSTPNSALGNSTHGVFDLGMLRYDREVGAMVPKFNPSLDLDTDFDGLVDFDDDDDDGDGVDDFNETDRVGACFGKMVMTGNGMTVSDRACLRVAPLNRDRARSLTDAPFRQGLFTCDPSEPACARLHQVEANQIFQCACDVVEAVYGSVRR